MAPAGIDKKSCHASTPNDWSHEETDDPLYADRRAINVKPLLLRHRWDGRFIIMSWEKAELRELKWIGSGHARPHCVTWQNLMIRIALS